MGDTVALAARAGDEGVPRVVAAIYEPAPDPATVLRAERRIRLQLPDLAQLIGAPDRVDRIGVALAEGVEADSAARALDAVAFGYRALPSAAVAARASTTFEVVSRFHDAIAIISIVASAIFLLCIMLLKVDERRQDAAVMRLIGIRRRTIFTALLLEAAAIAALGSLLGVGIAHLASLAVNAFYRQLFDTALVFSLLSPGIVLRGVLLSLVLGAVAGAVAAWRLVRARPLDLWRRA